MLKAKVFLPFCFLLVCAGLVSAVPVNLNESAASCFDTGLFNDICSDLCNGNEIYIEKPSFPADNNWQHPAKDFANTIMISTVGEGVINDIGVDDTEIFRLKTAPDASAALFSSYNGRSDLTTFRATSRQAGW